MADRGKLEPKEGETFDVRWAVVELVERRAPLDKRWEFYEGTQAEVFLSEKIRRALRTISRSFRFNYARTVVTAVLDRLNPESYTAGDDAAQTTLDELLEAVGYEDLSAEARELALVHGDAYLIVWPEEFRALRDDADELDDDEDQDDELGDVVDVSIELEAATAMTVAYHPRRKSEVRMAARLWSEAGVRHLELYYADRLERWVELTKGADHYRRATEWNEGGAWPYPDAMPELVPVFPLSTRRVGYGRSEHEDAIGPQSTIDKLVTGLMATIDYHGAPIRYALMREEDPTSSAAYDDLEEEDDDVDGEALDGRLKSTLRSGPGELWLLDAAEVGQFDQAVVSTYLEPWAAAVRSMAALTSTPVHVFEGFAGEVSGEAIRSAEAPLVKKAGKRQRLLGAGEAAALGYALELLGHDTEVVVAWEPAQFADDADAWEVAGAKVTLGIPLRHVLLEQGYTEEQLDGLGITSDDELPDPDRIANLIAKMAIAVPGILDRPQALAVLEVALGMDEGALGGQLATDDDDDELPPAPPEPPFI